MKLPNTRDFVIVVTLSDYAWYYLYHVPRYAIDKRYRKRHDDFENLLREAYRQGLLDMKGKA